MWNGYDPWRLNSFYYACAAICAAAVGLRLFANIKGLRKTAWYRDCLVIFALLCYAVLAGLETYMFKYHFYDDDPVANRFAIQGTRRVELVLMLGTISDFFYLPSIYFIKIDLLFLYHQLAPRRHHPKIFMVLLFSWLTVIAGLILTYFAPLFSCGRSFSHNWDLIPMQVTEDFTYYETHDCSFTDQAFLSLWAFHLATDVWVYAVPIWIIWRIQMMKTSQKWSAIAMFIVGFLNVVIALFTVISQQLVGPDNLAPVMNRANDFILAMQPPSAIILVCLPQIKSVWRYVAMKVKASRSEKSSDSSSGSGTETGKKGSQTSGEHDSAGITPTTTSDQAGKPYMVASVDNV